MKITKRTLTLVIALVLCAAMTIGGTLAFLQDSTEEVTNVMTLGNVTIEQNETFEQNAPLIPAVGDNNKVQKEITVTNTGKSDAYVRTLVAFEMGTMSEADFVKYVKWSYNSTDWTQGTPSIDAQGRYVVPFTYNSVLAAGDTTPASLLKVWLDSTAGNEEVEQLANAEGKYNVYALSQAVQTQGFADADTALNTAFGVPGAIPPPEADVTVSSQAELMAAIQNPANTVIGLNAGTYTLSSITNRDLTFVGEEAGVRFEQSGAVGMNGSKLTFNNVTVSFPQSTYIGYQHVSGLKYVGCTLEGTQFLYCDNTVEFSDCTFNVAGDAYAIWTYGCNATFENCTFNTDGKAVLVYNEGKKDHVIKLEDCTFNAATNRNKAAVETGDDPYTFTATFNIEFTNCVANGFVANKSTDPLWGNKNEVPNSRMDVTIDGVDVY